MQTTEQRRTEKIINRTAVASTMPATSDVQVL